METVRTVTYRACGEQHAAATTSVRLQEEGTLPAAIATGNANLIPSR